MRRAELLLVNLRPESDLGPALRSMLHDGFHLSSVSKPGPSKHARKAVTDELLGGLPVGARPEAIVLLASGRRTETESAITALRRQYSELPILAVVAKHDAETMADMSQLRVADFIIAPPTESEVLLRIRWLLGRWVRSDPLALNLLDRLGRRRLIGESPTFTAAIEKISIIAKCECSALIEGETGTGKEVCARAIHYLSSRADGPFVPVSCGAIPVELIENELFGHVRGAFTGASPLQHGLVHEAKGGTLFLDEIDCLPRMAQVKLLRVIQEREYRPLGSSQIRTADIRLVAATNTEIEEAVRTSRIRRDFYYRLNVLPLKLPPLRERQGDIILLARHFLAKFAREQSTLTPTLSASAIHALLAHDWPGNVRELEHVIERAVVFADGRSVIGGSEITIPFSRFTQSRTFREAKAHAIARFERSYIENLLVLHQGNITRAAEAAHKNRRAFWELIRKHHIDAGRFRESAPSETGHLASVDT